MNIDIFLTVRALCGVAIMINLALYFLFRHKEYSALIYSVVLGGIFTIDFIAALNEGTVWRPLIFGIGLIAIIFLIAADINFYLSDDEYEELEQNDTE